MTRKDFLEHKRFSELLSFLNDPSFSDRSGGGGRRYYRSRRSRKIRDLLPEYWSIVDRMGSR